MLILVGKTQNVIYINVKQYLGIDCKMINNRRYLNADHMSSFESKGTVETIHGMVVYK